jgi:uncharacterized RDD family membrane protein YckC
VDNSLAVLSPEKTILTYRLAGLGARILAHFLDVLIVIALVIAFSTVVSFTIAILDQGMAAAVLMIGISILIPFGYFVLLEGLWNGQTLGKKVMGLRVRMADGTPITFGSALGRNVLRIADFLPSFYFLGLLALFSTPRAQRLGDLVANTVVCYERRGTASFAPAPHIIAQHPLEPYVGELRGMTAEEYAALRRLCDRFPELGTPVQDRLLQDVWGPIAERRAVPSLPNVHPIYLAEAVVMKYGRKHGML